MWPYTTKANLTVKNGEDRDTGGSTQKEYVTGQTEKLLEVWAPSQRQTLWEDATASAGAAGLSAQLSLLQRQRERR